MIKTKDIDFLKIKAVEQEFIRKPMSMEEFNPFTGEVNVRGLSLMGSEVVGERERLNISAPVMEIPEIKAYYRLRNFVVTLYMIKKPEGERKNLLKEYGKMILDNISGKSNSVMILMENWEESGKNYSSDRMIKEFYTIKEAYELIQKYNKERILIPKPLNELVVLANTIEAKGAKAFTFDQEDMTSLKFLLSSVVSGNTIDNYPNGESRDTIAAFKDRNITEGTKKRFFTAVVEAFYELGLKFEQVRTTSAYRTHRWQAKYLLSDIGRKYWDSYKRARYLLRIMQEIINMSLENKVAHVVKYKELVIANQLDAYLESENEDATQIRIISENSEIASAVKNIIELKYPDHLVAINEKYLGGLTVENWEDKLIRIFQDEKFKPSPHPYGKAFDIINNKIGRWIHKYGTYYYEYLRSNFYHI